MNKIELFKNKSECCGCGACMNICPQNAISMKTDEYGYIYPIIKYSKCVSCGGCLKVCPLKKQDDLKECKETYAAALKEMERLKKSTSGGVFSSLAMNVLENKGEVFGAAYDEELRVHHISITDEEQLPLLQGSKYVQSDTEYIFKKVKQVLNVGKKVLFCGTPCQVSGLKNYLRKDYGNLITVDLLCHGVPSYQMFKESLNYLKIDNQLIKAISFRDKRCGWGTGGTICTERGNKNFNSLTSSYYYYYLRDSLNRESCYHCRFAGPKRVGDITLGDYWHIESAHPKEVSKFEIREGISCVMLNTDKGIEAFNEIKPNLITVPSKASFVEERNIRMRMCENEPELRQELLDLYTQYGWAGVEEFWKKNGKEDRMILRIKDMIPYRVKSWIKKKI